MDKQLQQRLTGAAIIVALAVIFIPELVERPTPEPVPAPTPPESAETPTTTVSLQPPAPVPRLADEPANIEPPEDEQARDETIVAGELPALPEVAESEAPLETGAVDPELPFDQPAEVQPAPDTQARAPTPPPAEEPAPRSEPPRRTEPPPRAEPPRRDPPPQPAERVAAVTPPPPPEPALPPLEMISRPMGQTGQGGGQTRSQTQSQPRWMVQAGSFSNAANASSLRDRLRSSNFSASLQQTVVDGRTMYRVQIGPHSSRDEGERTRERLRRELNIDGSIVPVYN